MESEPVALDSSAAILYFRRYTPARDLVANASEVYVPLIALGELFLGLERATNKASHESEISELLSFSNILYPDLQTAKVYSQLKAKLLAGGTPIPDNDLWIAALAKQAGLPLAARDEHFGFIQELEVVML